MPIMYAAAHQSGQGLELYYPHGNGVDIVMNKRAKIASSNKAISGNERRV
jgi:hypothetical protein